MSGVMFEHITKEFGNVIAVNETFLYVVTGENMVLARVDPRTDFHISDKAQVAFNMDKCQLFDIDTEMAIREP